MSILSHFGVITDFPISVLSLSATSKILRTSHFWIPKKAITRKPNGFLFCFACWNAVFKIYPLFTVSGGPGVRRPRPYVYQPLTHHSHLISLGHCSLPFWDAVSSFGNMDQQNFCEEQIKSYFGPKGNASSMCTCAERGDKKRMEVRMRRKQSRILCSLEHGRTHNFPKDHPVLGKGLNDPAEKCDPFPVPH